MGVALAETLLVDGKMRWRVVYQKQFYRHDAIRQLTPQTVKRQVAKNFFDFHSHHTLM
jgi:hypothetical protein